MPTLEQNLARLDSFRSINPGWVDGVNEGELIHPDAIRAAKTWLEQLERLAAWNGLPRGVTHCYPTPKGGVQFEWDWVKDRSVEVEFLAGYLPQVFRMWGEDESDETFADTDEEVLSLWKWLWGVA